MSYATIASSFHQLFHVEIEFFFATVYLFIWNYTFFKYFVYLSFFFIQTLKTFSVFILSELLTFELPFHIWTHCVFFLSDLLHFKSFSDFSWRISYVLFLCSLHYFNRISIAVLSYPNLKFIILQFSFQHKLQIFCFPPYSNPKFKFLSPISSFLSLPQMHFPYFPIHNQIPIALPFSPHSYSNFKFLVLVSSSLSQFQIPCPSFLISIWTSIFFVFLSSFKSKPKIPCPSFLISLRTSIFCLSVLIQI